MKAKAFYHVKVTDGLLAAYVRVHENLYLWLNGLVCSYVTGIGSMCLLVPVTMLIIGLWFWWPDRKVITLLP